MRCTTTGHDIMQGREERPSESDVCNLWLPILSCQNCGGGRASATGSLAGSGVSASFADPGWEWSMYPLSRLLVMCPACRACSSKASIGLHLYRAHGIWFNCMRMFDLSTNNAHTCAYSLRLHYGHVWRHKCSIMHVQECATTYRPPEVAPQDMWQLQKYCEHAFAS